MSVIIPLLGERAAFLTLWKPPAILPPRSARERIDPLEFEPLDQFHQRQKKLREIEALGHAPYPHKFAWTHTPKQIAEEFGDRTAEQLG